MRRIVFLPALTAILVLLALFPASATPFARATTPGVVISQIYAGGGNSGATFQNDYVELFNRGSSSVDLSGSTLQYATSGGSTWQVTTLSGSIAAGNYYLVQLASSASVGSVLPQPDAAGTTNLAASGGKVAFVRSTSALTCGATAGSCSSVSTIGDFVGYGSATDYEGTGAAPALDSTSAAIRAAGGCTDSGSNAADFAAQDPAPRNSSTTALSCGGTTSTSGVQSSSVDIDVAPVISLSLDHASLSFGAAVTGSTPAPLAEHVSVFSNHATGYSLSVHRSAFSPADLPLAVSATAPTGGHLGSLLGSGLVPLPIAPAADLVLGTTSAASPATGDVWPVGVGFSSALPAVAPGHYTATVTFTVVGR